MSDPKTGAWPGKRMDFESFPENLELVKNIQERVKGVRDLEAYRGALLGATDVFENVIAIERYIAQVYADVKYNRAESSMKLCVGAAAEAFLISLNYAPRFYGGHEEAEKRPVEGDVVIFVKKMGDSIAMNEIDLDLGSSRWTTSTDLLMDMLASLTVASSSIILQSEDKKDENMADSIDMEYNVITGTTLIAAYAMILYQCIKDGAYRGQTLADIKR